MDHRTVRWADVVAVRGLGWLAFEQAVAVGEGQVVGRLIQAIDRLQPPPDGVARAIPTELVGVDEPPRGDRAYNDPWQKAVAGRQPQVSRRFPASAAGIIEHVLGIIRERKAGLGLRAAEV